MPAPSSGAASRHRDGLRLGSDPLLLLAIELHSLSSQHQLTHHIHCCSGEESGDRVVSLPAVQVASVGPSFGRSRQNLREENLQILMFGINIVC